MYGIFNTIGAIACSIGVVLLLLCVVSLFAFDLSSKVYKIFAVLIVVSFAVGIITLITCPAGKYTDDIDLAHRGTWVTSAGLGDLYELDGVFYVKVQDPEQSEADAFQNGPHYINVQVEPQYVFEVLTAQPDQTSQQEKYCFQIAVELGYINYPKN